MKLDDNTAQNIVVILVVSVPVLFVLGMIIMGIIATIQGR